MINEFDESVTIQTGYLEILLVLPRLLGPPSNKDNIFQVSTFICCFANNIASVKACCFLSNTVNKLCWRRWPVKSQPGFTATVDDSVQSCGRRHHSKACACTAGDNAKS